MDREQDVITCYEKAGDIALLYLQEIERVSGHPRWTRAASRSWETPR